MTSLAILQNSRHEHQRPPQAITRGKMRVGNHFLQQRIVEKLMDDSDARTEGIGQGFGRGEGGPIRSIALSRVHKFAQNGQPSAGSANGHIPRDGLIQSLLHGGSHPEIDVVRLVAAGNEYRFGVAYGRGGKRIFGGGAIRKYQSRDRVDLAKALNIGVIVIVSAGPKDEKIAAAGTLAHPLEGAIEIIAAAQQREASLGLRLHVRGIARAKILIVRAGGKRRAQQ